MKNLKNIIVSFILLTISSCVIRPTIPKYDEIPRGEQCLLLRKNGFCINNETEKEYSKSFRKMRGYECVPMNYKKDLELFLYDILEENAKLRLLCGEPCEGV